MDRDCSGRLRRRDGVGVHRDRLFRHRSGPLASDRWLNGLPWYSARRGRESAGRRGCEVAFAGGCRVGQLIVVARAPCATGSVVGPLVAHAACSHRNTLARRRTGHRCHCTATGTVPWWPLSRSPLSTPGVGAQLHTASHGYLADERLSVVWGVLKRRVRLLRRYDAPPSTVETPESSRNGRYHVFEGVGHPTEQAPGRW